MRDLREARERAALVRQLYAKSSPRDRSRLRRWAGSGAVGTTSTGFASYLLITGSDVANALAGGLFAAVATGAAVAFAGLIMKVIWDDRRWERVPGHLRRASRLDPIAFRPRYDRPAVIREGSVKLQRPVYSPLSGRACAAYRISGVGPSGVIDDADIGRFEVIGEWGKARVEGPPGLVGFEVTGAPEEVAASDELEAFLRCRGVCPPNTKVELSETLLLEGDRVEVRGVLEERLEPAGLRAVQPVAVFGAAVELRAPKPRSA